jgi:hypothetical protein
VFFYFFQKMFLQVAKYFFLQELIKFLWYVTRGPIMVFLLYALFCSFEWLVDKIRSLPSKWKKFRACYWRLYRGRKRERSMFLVAPEPYPSLTGLGEPLQTLCREEIYPREKLCHCSNCAWYPGWRCRNCHGGLAVGEIKIGLYLDPNYYCQHCLRQKILPRFVGERLFLLGSLDWLPPEVNLLIGKSILHLCFDRDLLADFEKAVKRSARTPLEKQALRLYSEDFAPLIY